MTKEEVVYLYILLEKLGIKIWIDGGWAVDALLGEQTREHKDLDVAVNKKDSIPLIEFLEKSGYKEIRRDSEDNIVFGNNLDNEIDVHVFILDDKGNVVGGIEYPTESLSGSGTINGQVVRCISPDYMVKFLTPWLSKHPDKYLKDISALCKKFGIEYPKEYLNFTKSSSNTVH